MYEYAHGHALYAARAELRCNFLPQQGRERVADETVQDTARLLGLDEVAVHLARVLERTAYGVLRDLMKDHAANGHVRAQYL